MSYHQKYLKYKTKYLNLRTNVQQGGGFGSVHSVFNPSYQKFVYMLSDLQKVGEKINDPAFPQIDVDYIKRLVDHVNELQEFEKKVSARDENTMEKKKKIQIKLRKQEGELMRFYDWTQVDELFLTFDTKDNLQKNMKMYVEGTIKSVAEIK